MTATTVYWYTPRKPSRNNIRFITKKIQPHILPPYLFFSSILDEKFDFYKKIFRRRISIRRGKIFEVKSDLSPKDAEKKQKTQKKAPTFRVSAFIYNRQQSIFPGGLPPSIVNAITQAGIKIAGRNINNLRYADDSILMAESEEELKSLVMKEKEESLKVGLRLNFRKQRSLILVPSLHGK